MPLNIKADNSLTVTSKGAQIRTEIDGNGYYGIRFIFETSEDVMALGQEVTFTTLVALGSVEKDVILSKGTGVYSIVADKYFDTEKLLFAGSIVSVPDVEAGLEDAEGSIRIYNPVEKEISAVGVLKVGDTEYTSDVITRNLVDVARNHYNKNEVSETSAVAKLVKNREARIENNNLIKYVSATDLKTTDIEANSFVELCRGNYSGLVLNNSDIVVNGVQKDIGFDEKNRKEEKTNLGESIIQSTVCLNNNNLTINGLKIDAEDGIEILNSDLSNINIKYCDVDYSGSNGIKTSGSTSTTVSVANVTIDNNLIFGSSNDASVGIHMGCLAKNIEITNNYIGNNVRYLVDDKPSFLENDFGIQIYGMANGAFLNIKDNTFDHQSAAQLIDAYAQNSSTPKRSAYINIENNNLNVKGDSDTYILGGNAIRLNGLNENSSISIIHNYNARISPYMNAIEIKKTSQGFNCGKNNAINTAGDLRVDLLFNEFSNVASLSSVSQPEGRNALEARYVRIGIGVPATSNVRISGNYYMNASHATSSYAYVSLTSAQATQGSYHSLCDAPIILRNEEASSKSNADTKYNEWLSGEYATSVSSAVSSNEYTEAFAPIIIYCLSHNIPVNFTAEAFTHQTE